jgi:nitrogen-specific signal transduction histidine kinase
MLADFTAVGFKQQKQQAHALAQERISAAAKMAHQLAHEINNPLQSMTNAAFLVAAGGKEEDTKSLGRDLSDDIQRLSSLVKKLLAIPFDSDKAKR